MRRFRLGEKWLVSRREIGFGEGSVGEGRRVHRGSCSSSHAERQSTYREVAAEGEAESLRRGWCEPVRQGTPRAIVMGEDECRIICLGLLVPVS